MSEHPQRTPWHEGPDEDAPPESWLALDDDELLHRIETLSPGEDHDDELLDVVSSHRHFFIRQEAAKRIHDRRRLFAFEDDRHVGQILVRHLTRREDLTYLERLSTRSHHVEVRSAAQVQLARVWRRLEAPKPTAGDPKTDPVGLRAVTLPPDTDPALTPVASSAAASAPIEPPADPVALAAAAETVQPLTSDAVAEGGVDSSLLGWAAHFIVESAWKELGTTATRELLRRTLRELARERRSLGFFQVTEDAHVAATLAAGARIPREAVREVAEWMTAFRAAAREVAPGLEGTTVRGCTALMADALRDAGFYTACDEAEVASLRRG
jgi:hypothetical protein